MSIRFFAATIFVCMFTARGMAATVHVNSSVVSSDEDGSQDRTYQTLAAALKNVAPGDRLLIAPGVYRETLDLTTSKLKGVKNGPRTIIEGEKGAIIKGSDLVTGWEPQANGVFTKRNWPHNSQQVFVDGVLMKQIGGTLGDAFARLKQDEWPGRVEGDRDDLVPGSFYYDAAEKSLYLKPSEGGLSGKTVEVSVRPYLVFSDEIHNYTLRNIAAMHANSTAHGRGAAVRLSGNNIVAKNIDVSWTDGTGIGLIGDNNSITDSAANFNGQLGMACKGRNVKITGNETNHNNVRGFNKHWEAGGMKCIGPGGSSPSGLQDSVIEQHRALHNNGTGIWLDRDNRNVVVRDNVVGYNEMDGIHYEISFSGNIVGNEVFKNRVRGIYIANSAGTTVQHNMVVANNGDGIAVNGERTSDPKYTPVNNKIVGNIVAWNGKTALRLPPSDIPSESNRNLFVEAGAPKFGIWRKPAYPKVTGLSDWNEMSGQDKNSWQRTMPMPAELAAKMERGETDLEWPMLTSIAQELGIEMKPSGRRD